MSLRYMFDHYNLDDSRTNLHHLNAAITKGRLSPSLREGHVSSLLDDISDMS